MRKFREKSRDRFLQPDELPRFFAALEEEENEVARDYILISLLTGARKSNVLAMRWEEISFARAEWRIPETKNGDPLAVALSSQAVEILKDRRLKTNTDWVFPSEDSKTGHLADPKKAWARLLERAGIKDLRIHDLRRSLGSWQASTGASGYIIGKFLGHKSQQATQIYARLTLDPVRESVERATEAMMAAGTRHKARVKSLSIRVTPGPLKSGWTARRSGCVRSKSPNFSGVTAQSLAVTSATLWAFLDVRQLIGGSVLIESFKTNKVGKEHVAMMHRFYTPVQIGSRREVIRIVAMQTKEGLKLRPDEFDLYDIIPEQIAASPANAATLPRGANTAPNSGGSSTVTIAEMLRNVKDSDGKPYFSTLFQQNRGSINFDAMLQKVVISLTSGANLSTLLHESGHYFSLLHRQTADMAREALAGGTVTDPEVRAQLEQVVEDWDRMKSALGVEGDSLTVAQEEQIATWFEQYLREGHAPKAELRGAFATFKSWLLQIYKTLKDGVLGKSINNDVRSSTPSKPSLFITKTIQPGKTQNGACSTHRRHL